MKNPHETLADARIRVTQLERELCVARAAEIAAEAALNAATRFEHADTIPAPPPPVAP